MKSPFPGMDPFLEGHIWPDVHNSLIYQIRQQLAPQISPHYIAKIEPYTFVDEAPENDIGIMYPDVGLLRKNKENSGNIKEDDTENYGILTPPSITIPVNYPPVELSIPVLEIRDASGHQLVTTIEILSPVNKRGKGLKQYKEKQKRLIERKVHLVEIDLLRRGERVFSMPLLNQSHYLISLIKGGESQRQIWTFNIQENLPVIPIPLKTTDKEVTLDLNQAMKEAYEAGYYHLSINYEENAPPPVFSAEDLKWIESKVTGD